METNKIYARINQNGIVMHIFSEVFEQPLETDICINETNTDRQGANAYQVYDYMSIPNYKIVNGVMIQRDKTLDLQKIATSQRIAELKQLLQASDYMAIKFAEGAVSSDEFALIKLSRAQWRAEINALDTVIQG